MSIIKKIKKWLSKNKRINELNKRINEVLHRAGSEAPLEVLESSFREYKFWLLKPLIIQDYKHYEEVVKDEEARQLNKTIYTILEEKEDKDAVLEERLEKETEETEEEV